MRKPFARLFAVTLMLVVVLGVRGQRTLLAYEGDCYCDFYNGGGVFIYDDDGTFVDQLTTTTLTGIYQSPGSNYCADYCFNYGHYAGETLCARYGTGHKFNMVGFFVYEDANNYYGGSGSAWYDSSAMYECP